MPTEEQERAWAKRSEIRTQELRAAEVVALQVSRSTQPNPNALARYVRLRRERLDLDTIGGLEP